jgi:short-subunit dehydrogenase
MALNPRITQWSGRSVWLIGASSGIGRALAEQLHGLGARVVVSARNATALQTLAAQHPGMHVAVLDATDASALQTTAAQLQRELQSLDLVMYCAGHYKALRAQEFDLQEMLRHEQVNYIGALNMLAAVLPIMLQQGAGHISLISSVAGYRGLPKSLAYGPTKAALINLAEVLYLDLHEQGIGVSLVNPGFVETPLTSKNTFRMPALIKPAQAAIEIIAGWQRGEFEIHFPKRFSRTMKLLKHLPNTAYFAAIKRFTGL